MCVFTAQLVMFVLFVKSAYVGRQLQIDHSKIEKKIQRYMLFWFAGTGMLKISCFRQISHQYYWIPSVHGPSPSSIQNPIGFVGGLSLLWSYELFHPPRYCSLHPLCLVSWFFIQDKEHYLPTLRSLKFGHKGNEENRPCVCDSANNECLLPHKTHHRCH